MTHEAYIARKVAVDFEAKKDGLKQNQNGTIKFILNINPDDMPPSLYTDSMGQRYTVALVALNGDETPREEPPKVKRKSRAGEGKLLPQDPLFNEYIDSRRHELTYLDFDNEKAMKQIINIKSCAELIEGSDEYFRFKELRKDFNRYKIVKQQEAHYDPSRS